MRPIVLVLSGAIAVGKSTLAAGLAELGFYSVKSTALMRRALDTKSSPPTPAFVHRETLQAVGDELDAATNGAWLAQHLHLYLTGNPQRLLLVDAARTANQIAHIRKLYGACVVHAHLAAPVEKLAQRYFSRAGQAADGTYGAFSTHNATEANVGKLAHIADVVIDTTNCTADDVLVRVAGHLGLFGRGTEKLVDVLVGGFWGSEGKGQVSAYLAPEYDVLVRVGGPNAGHKVWEGGEQKSYTFYHLPSGTRSTNAQIILGAGSVIGLAKLLEEVADCGLTPDRLSVDPNAVIIDNADIAMERTLGSAVATIGSTGQGVGAATARKALRTMAESQFGLANRMAKNEPALQPFIRDTVGLLERHYAHGRRIFLEGTQGTHLSLHHGSFPHVTSRDTTVQGTLADAGIPASRVRKSVIVCRSYPIRVQSPDESMQGVEGATSGPMGQEITWQEIAERSGYEVQGLTKSEMTSTTKRRRRVAEFSWPAFRRSVTLNGPTDVALTFADYYGKENSEARRYEQLNDQARRQIEEMERIGGAPVSLVAVRFRHRSIIDRRSW